MFEGMTIGAIRQQARSDAAAVLSEYWVDRSLPIDPVEIARAMGNTVFEAELGVDTYGMVRGNASGADIFVDRDDPPNRKRFTVAHELGHVTAHSGRIDDTSDLDYVEVRNDGRSGTAAEVHANEFAGELLMPQSQLKQMIESGTPNMQIALHFGVSVHALSYRRQILGI